MNRIVYTYWTDNGENYGCNESDQTLFAKMALVSVTSALEQVDNVVCYCDVAGKDYLQTLEIPFTEYVVVDFSALGFNKTFWNYPKLVTYSMQTEPFLHIDFDVYLKDVFIESLTNADIITELCRPYNFHSIFDALYPGTVEAIPAALICSGLIGGNDFAHFGELLTMANQSVFNQDINATLDHLYAIEEFNHSMIATTENYSIQPLDRNLFSHWQGAGKYALYGTEINRLYSEL